MLVKSSWLRVTGLKENRFHSSKQQRNDKKLIFGLTASRLRLVLRENPAKIRWNRALESLR